MRACSTRLRSWSTDTLLIGELIFKNDDFSNASRSFLNAITMNPADMKAYNNLGGLYWHQGNVQDSVKCIEAALRINPQNERTLQNYRELLKAGIEVKRPPQPTGNVSANIGGFNV